MVLAAVAAAQACPLEGPGQSFFLTHDRESYPNGAKHVYAYKFDSVAGAFGSRIEVAQVDAGNEKLAAFWDFDNDGDHDVLTYYAFFDNQPSPHVTVRFFLYRADPVLCFVKTTVVDTEVSVENSNLDCPADDAWCRRFVPGTADLNGDGFFDILFFAQGTARSTAKLYLAVNNQNGAFSPPQYLLTEVSIRYIGNRGGIIPAADYNNDGRPDLLTLDYHTYEGCRTMPVRRRLGISSFPYFGSSSNLFTTTDSAHDLFPAGDVDEDSDFDLLYGLDDDGDTGQLWLRRGRGDGTLLGQEEVFDIYGGGQNCPGGPPEGFGTLALHDFTLDGVDDIVLCQSAAPYPNNKLWFVLGLGNGRYDWDQRVELGNCFDKPLAGPGFAQCRQLYQECTADDECCQVSDGYPFDQWCSAGYCCPLGSEWNPATGTCEQLAQLGRIEIVFLPRSFWADDLRREQDFDVACYDDQVPENVMVCPSVPSWGTADFGGATDVGVDANGLFHLQTPVQTSGQVTATVADNGDVFSDAADVEAKPYSILVEPSSASLGYGEQQQFDATCWDNEAPPNPLVPCPGSLAWNLVDGLQGDLSVIDEDTALFTAPDADASGRIRASVGTVEGFAGVIISNAQPPTPPPLPEDGEPTVLLLSCPRLAYANETNVTMQCWNATSGAACERSAISLTGAPNSYIGPAGANGFVYSVETVLAGDYRLTASVEGIGESGCKIARVGVKSTAVPEIHPVAVLFLLGGALLLLRRSAG